MGLFAQEKIVSSFNACALVVLLLLISCTQEKQSANEATQDKLTRAVDSSVVTKDIPRKTESVKSVLNGLVEVSIPPSFQLMGQQLVTIKYPTKVNGRFIVFTDSTTTVNIAFEQTSNPMRPADIRQMKNTLDAQFNRPPINYRKSEIKKISGRDFIIIEMITPSADEAIYNLMIVTSCRGNMFIGTFNCFAADSKNWEILANEIINSVELKE